MASVISDARPGLVLDIVGMGDPIFFLKKVAGEQVFAETSEFEGRSSLVHDRGAHNHDFVSLTTTATCTAYGVLVCRAIS